MQEYRVGCRPFLRVLIKHVLKGFQDFGLLQHSTLQTLKKDVFENISKKAKKLSVKNEQLYCVNQKKQHLNHISTTFTTIFKQYFMSCKNI